MSKRWHWWRTMLRRRAQEMIDDPGRRDAARAVHDAQMRLREAEALQQRVDWLGEQIEQAFQRKAA